MASIQWDHSSFLKNTKKRALDGVEECARGPMAIQAKRDCPVDSGTLRGTIGVERDEKAECVYLGCGGAAKAYAHRQETDRSLNHPSGKAGFIRDSVQMHNSKLGSYVKKHI